MYAVASTPTMASSVFMRRFRLFWDSVVRFYINRYNHQKVPVEYRVYIASIVFLCAVTCTMRTCRLGRFRLLKKKTTLLSHSTKCPGSNKRRLTIYLLYLYFRKWPKHLQWCRITVIFTSSPFSNAEKPRANILPTTTCKKLWY